MSHQVVTAPPTKVINVCMCYYGAVDQTPGVNKKAPLFTIQPIIGDSKQWVSVQVHAIIIDTTQDDDTPPFVVRSTCP